MAARCVYTPTSALHKPPWTKTELRAPALQAQHAEGGGVNEAVLDSVLQNEA